MVYDLTRLGERAFEDLCRAIAVHVLGTQVQAFGDGPDGGRELAWEGRVAYPGSDPSILWSGSGVLQAKFRRQNAGVKDLDWLRGRLREEFAAWSSPSAARVRRGSLPDFLIVATNVRLTSVAGVGGIDQARAMIAEQAARLGLKASALWDANQISMYLDAYPSVAQRFSAFITPSDVLAETKQALTALKTRPRSGNPAARCPSCKSQQMSQRMPALYREERRETSTRVEGRTYRTTSVSAFGRRIAPPRARPFPLLVVILAGISALCFLGSAQSLLDPDSTGDPGTDVTTLLVSLAGVAALLPSTIRVLRNRDRVKGLAGRARWLWERTWCCRRCDIAWVSTAELPRELWGRAFRTGATTENLYAIARNVQAHQASNGGRGAA